MELGRRNEGKAQGFARRPIRLRVVALAAAIASLSAPAATRAQVREQRECVLPPPAAATLHGDLIDARDQPVVGATVTFHYHATLGLPWVRATAQEIVVERTTTDAQGRFALTVPAGVAGTCASEVGGARAIATRCVAGESVRLRLAATRVRVFSLGSESALPSLELVFEGPSPLAAATVAVRDGRVSVPHWPGVGALLLLPEGIVGRSSGAPWFGVAGLARERLPLMAAPLRTVALRWCATLDAPSASRRAGRGYWGADALTFCGQGDDGVPFVARGDVCVRATLATTRRTLDWGIDLVVVTSTVAVTVADGDVVPFTAADQLTPDGDALVCPAWVPALEGALFVGRDADGWRVLDVNPPSGRPSPAWALRGVVLGGDRVPVGRVNMRVRPRHCRPLESWHSFAGLECTGRAHGEFALPVRLCDGDYDWVAMAPDGRVALGSVQIGGADRELVIELRDGGELCGLVIDADGEAIAGLAVDLRAGKSEVESSFGWPEHRAFTGLDGEFRLRGLDPEQPYELTCVSAAWGEVVVDGVRAGSPSLSLQLRPPAAPR